MQNKTAHARQAEPNYEKIKIKPWNGWLRTKVHTTLDRKPINLGSTFSTAHSHSNWTESPFTLNKWPLIPSLSLKKLQDVLAHPDALLIHQVELVLVSL